MTAQNMKEIIEQLKKEIEDIPERGLFITIRCPDRTVKIKCYGPEDGFSIGVETKETIVSIIHPQVIRFNERTCDIDCFVSPPMLKDMWYIGSVNLEGATDYIVNYLRPEVTE